MCNHWTKLSDKPPIEYKEVVVKSSIQDCVYHCFYVNGHWQSKKGIPFPHTDHQDEWIYLNPEPLDEEQELDELYTLMEGIILKYVGVLRGVEGVPPENSRLVELVDKYLGDIE